jgi:HSP90 family molecular chaperone
MIISVKQICSDILKINAKEFYYYTSDESNKTNRSPTYTICRKRNILLIFLPKLAFNNV